MNVTLLYLPFYYWNRSIFVIETRLLPASVSIQDGCHFATIRPGCNAREPAGQSPGGYEWRKLGICGWNTWGPIQAGLEMYVGGFSVKQSGNSYMGTVTM